jgi:hypothetical protein
MPLDDAESVRRGSGADDKLCGQECPMSVPVASSGGDPSFAIAPLRVAPPVGVHVTLSESFRAVDPRHAAWPTVLTCVLLARRVGRSPTRPPAGARHSPVRSASGGDIGHRLILAVAGHQGSDGVGPFAPTAGAATIHSQGEAGQLPGSAAKRTPGPFPPPPALTKRGVTPSNSGPLPP